MKAFSLSVLCDGKCCESHLSLSLNRFVQVNPLIIFIKNQMNSVLSKDMYMLLNSGPLLES